MKLYYQDNDTTIYEGSSEEMLEKIAPNSIDAIITDPPYELGILNEKWDNTGIAFSKDYWRKCFEVLKDGAYLMAFGGSRTYHRIAVAIEDAGFKIKDTLMWLYGSGFPKSMNIGVAFKKRYGNELNAKEQEIYNEFKDYGTTLKPAYEPIILAKKPNKGSTIDNLLKYRCGAINIKECLANNDRYPANVMSDMSIDVVEGAPISTSNGGQKTMMPDFSQSKKGHLSFGQNYETLGRKETINYHAIQDEGSVFRYFYSAKASKKDRDEGLEKFKETQRTDGSIRANQETERKFGSNSAYAKNFHPTVKPTELMQYLVRLIAPKGATILDPFCGSGSTGKAVAFENRERNKDYKFIGIELNKEYLPLIVNRIDYAKHKFKYDEENELKETGHAQLHLFE